MRFSKFPKLRAIHLTFVLTVVVVIIATALTIYLTPLRYTTLFPATMREMDPKEFYAAFSAHPDRYILIDVRSPSIYEDAHAQGAINIPVENFYDDRFTLPHSGVQIGLICTTGRLAAIAYGYLEDQGFTNLIHVEGGMVNWTTEGLPVEGKNIAAGLSTSTPDLHQ